MWKEKRHWDFTHVGGTGDMPSFEHGGHVSQDVCAHSYEFCEGRGCHFTAFDKRGLFLGQYGLLDDAKKAVEDYAA